MRGPDAGLEVALEHRERAKEQAQQVLSEHQRALEHQAGLLSEAQARVRMVLRQIDAAQRPAPGVPLAVAVLGDLERLLDWCEAQVLVHEQRLNDARSTATQAREALAAAHQQVRALELVLESRKAERAEERHRAELRLADETAAQAHARSNAGRP